MSAADALPAEYLLIRARTVGAAELRLRDHLAPVFGTRIRFVLDASVGRPLEAEGAIIITRDWIAARGLARFAGSGWRCGDYCYYAALDAVPDLGRAWLIESDVWLSYADPREFFGPLAEDPADFLAPAFRERGDDWFWTWSAVAALGEGPVWGCLYPITRMTARAIAHCARVRAESLAASAGDLSLSRSDAPPYPIPNDEGFTATALMRAGFDCRDLRALLPGAFSDAGFSWDAPLMRAEALGAGLAGQVLHPVLEAAEARVKLALMRTRRPDRFAARRAAAIAAVGQAAWDRWAGPEA